MEALSQVREHVVAAGRTDQGDAARQSVGSDRGRDGDGGEVEQVDEVGVVAEAPVGLERLSQHGGDGVCGGRSGHDQYVGMRPEPRRRFLQRVQVRDALKQVRRGKLRCASDDLVHHGVDLICVPLEEGPDRRHALSYPGPFIQQRCGIQKQREIRLGGLPADALKHARGVLEGAPGALVAIELQWIGHREAELRAAGCWPQIQDPRVGIGRIIAARRIQHRDRVRGSQREHRDAVQ
jgi:hypothetical protein